MYFIVYDILGLNFVSLFCSWFMKLVVNRFYCNYCFNLNIFLLYKSVIDSVILFDVIFLK